MKRGCVIPGPAHSLVFTNSEKFLSLNKIIFYSDLNAESREAETISNVYERIS